MAHRFKVELLLDDATLREFREFTELRTTTIERAWRWMTDRRYGIGRTAVGEWIRHERATLTLTTLPAVTIASDAEARERIRQWCDGLRGQELRNVAFFAAFLVSQAAGREAKRQRQMDQSASDKPTRRG